MSEIYNIEFKNSSGERINLTPYKDKVVLIVNVASKCGYTPQYAGLEVLYKKFKDQGLVILGFPCNQFGGQEPGTAEEIQSFCNLNYGVTFPIFAKINVNGAEASPLYNFLKEKAPGILGIEAIKWNFTKFLINKKGEVVERFAPITKPEEIETSLNKWL